MASRHGFTGSLTMACRAWLEIGTRKPAFSANTLVCPATAIQTLPAATAPLIRLHTGYASAGNIESGDFALLDDIHAQRTGRARVAPDDSIVTRGAAAPLNKPAVNRIAGVEIDQRHDALDVLGRQDLRIDTVYLDRVGPAPHPFEFMVAAREIYDAALAQHDIEVEFFAQLLVQL